MFIARQPIFNRLMKVHGYELLYRGSETATTFENKSSERATATVVSGLFELGIDTISDNKISFINFDHEFIYSDTIELIDPDDLVIEILENTIVDKKLVHRLIDLKQKGYKIALDDFVEDYDVFPLIPLVDIIKYDVMATPLYSIEKEVRCALADRKILVAEKIETKEEFEIAKRMGFQLFQGFFFDKPSIVGKISKKKSPKLSYLELMNELNKPEPSFTRLTEIIINDVNLAHRLFLSTKKNKTTSNDFRDRVRQSLVYMGFKQIKRWINILMLQDLSANKPDELTRLSLIRAHFGELISMNSQFKSRSNELYGMFLFSTLDALLDQTMETALEDLDLPKDVKQALIFNKGELNPILQLVFAYEKGEWSKVSTLSEQINLDETKISSYYVESIQFSKEIMDDTHSY